MARKSSYTNVRNEMGNVSGFDGAAFPISAILGNVRRTRMTGGRKKNEYSGSKWIEESIYNPVWRK